MIFSSVRMYQLVRICIPGLKYTQIRNLLNKYTKIKKAVALNNFK